MNVTPPVKDALLAVLGEAGKYMNEIDQSLVVGGFDVMLSATRPEYGLNEMFLLQSLDTALDLARLGLRNEYLACALLYYPLVTQAISVEKVGDKFGDVVIHMVTSLLGIAARFENGLPWYSLPSKVIIDKTKQKKGGQKLSKRRKRDEIRGPMAFLTIASTAEIAILKAVDRLHLLKWSEKLIHELDLRQRVAQQTMEIYAPVADILGVWSLKWQLEDAAFKILQPIEYRAIAQGLAERRAEREARIQKAIGLLSARLSESGLKAKVVGRPKHIFSIHEKMSSTGASIGEVNDILGLRVILETEEDNEGPNKECYQALDILFQLWSPAEGVYDEDKFFRDWIVNPKPNGYQSIHTTVIYDGRPVEVQIRTRTMHDLAEYGAAAHWVYKKTGDAPRAQRLYQGYVKQVGAVKRAWEARGSQP